MGYRSTVPNTRFSSKFAVMDEAFRRLGAVLDSPSGDTFVWRLTIDGRCLTFFAETFPLNTASAWRLARDKLASYQVLEAAGVRIPRGLAYFKPSRVAGATHVEPQRLVETLEEQLRQTFPDECQGPESLFVVKPGEASGGAGVRICRGIKETLAYAAQVFDWGHYGLVQEFVRGAEYRVVILNGACLLTYERTNASLTGDGLRSIEELLRQINPQLCVSLCLATNFERLAKLSARPEVTLKSVLAPGDQLELCLEANNLSQGGRPIVHPQPPASILKSALRAHALLGLSFSGVDIRLPSADAEPVILEVNANPGFMFFRQYYPELTDGLVDKIAAAIVQFVHKHGERSM